VSEDLTISSTGKTLNLSSSVDATATNLEAMSDNPPSQPKTQYTAENAGEQKSLLTNEAKKGPPPPGHHGPPELFSSEAPVFGKVPGSWEPMNLIPLLMNTF